MITTYVNPLENGDGMVITIHGRICSKDILHTRIETDKAKAERWISKVYRDIIAETVIRFIHHRRSAANHFQTPQTEILNALAILEVRFNSAKQSPLKKLVELVSRSKEHLNTIMPPANSYWNAWIDTIQSTITQCKTISEGLRDQSRKEAFSAMEVGKRFTGYVLH